MKIIGITGGIGSGKSSVSKILSEQGGYIIDADKINHEIMKKNSLAYYEIINYFGKDILYENGEIDRKKLGQLVFGNKETHKENLKTLEKINHKYVIKETFNIILRLNKTDHEYKFIVIDAPLLVEARLHNLCDKVIVVYASQKIAIDRIIKRDNASHEQALARINNQTSFEELKKHADYILYNNRTFKHLKEKVLDILSDMKIQ